MPPNENASPVFFYTDVYGLSLIELWRMAPNWITFCYVLARKFAGLRSEPTCAIAFDHIEFTPVGELDDTSLQLLDSAVDECKSLGFTPDFAQTYPVIGDIFGAGIVLTNNDGAILALATVTGNSSRTEVVIGFLSELSDGRIVSSGATRQRLKLPPGYIRTTMEGADAADVLRAHREVLSQIQNAKVLVHGSTARQHFIRASAERHLEFNKQRGFYARLSPAEAARLEAMSLSR